MRRAGMRARWAAALLGAALLAGVLPLSMAVAEEPGQTGSQTEEVSVEPRAASEVYVSFNGSDESGNGSANFPYASLATAGSGDVLGGIIAGTIACTHGEVDVWEKLVSYAVTLHSLSGFVAASKFGEKSVIATDLIDVIGDAMNAFVTAALEEMGVANEGQEA